MKTSFLFFINSVLLGIGLAMDAFSVSMANGLNEPNMKKGRMNLIAGTYGFFQFAMPLIGWICVHTIVEYFSSFQKFIPYIALILLLYIGIGMIKDSKEEQSYQNTNHKLGFSKLIVQAIATSIDALSVGFTISEYDFKYSLFACLIIGIVTHIISFFGLTIGEKFGVKLAGKASILGGVILIGIGLEIFLTGIL